MNNNNLSLVAESSNENNLISAPEIEDYASGSPYNIVEDKEYVTETEDHYNETDKEVHGNENDNDSHDNALNTDHDTASTKPEHDANTEDRDNTNTDTDAHIRNLVRSPLADQYPNIKAILFNTYYP